MMNNGSVCVCGCECVYTHLGHVNLFIIYDAQSGLLFSVMSGTIFLSG